MKLSGGGSATRSQITVVIGLLLSGHLSGEGMKGPDRETTADEYQGKREIEASQVESQRQNGSLLVKDRRFSGVWIERYADGRLKSRSRYEDGRRNGTSEVWYASGRPSEIRWFRNGSKEGGHKGWWENGTARFELNFKDNNYEGTCREWYCNGQLYRLNNYHAGEEVGAQEMWYQDGTVLANYVVKDGRRYGLTGSLGCYPVSR